MQTPQRWRVSLDFSADFPVLRGGIYLRIINECWRMLPHQHPHIVCSALQLRSDGVSGFIESTSISAAADALDTFRHKSTDHVRRLCGKRDAVLWEYIQFHRCE